MYISVPIHVTSVFTTKTLIFMTPSTEVDSVPFIATGRRLHGLEAGSGRPERGDRGDRERKREKTSSSAGLSTAGPPPLSPLLLSQLETQKERRNDAGGGGGGRRGRGES